MAGSHLRRAIDLLRAHGIRVVVFDMDQTAVAMHSRGELERTRITEYTARVTPDFVNLARALHEHNFGLAIATHSDQAEYGQKRQEVQPETHILGDELAKALLDACFSAEISRAFFIVAYNPRWRDDGNLSENKIKRKHMRLIQEHFQCTKEQIIFFDDTDSVVEDCRDECGICSVKVDPSIGFILDDLLNAFTTSS